MLNSRKYFENDARLKAQAEDICKFTFALSIKCLLFYPALALIYDKVKHQQRFICIPLTFRRRYTVGVNSLENKEPFGIILGSESEKFKILMLGEKLNIWKQRVQ